MCEGNRQGPGVAALTYRSSHLELWTSPSPVLIFYCKEGPGGKRKPGSRGAPSPGPFRPRPPHPGPLSPRDASRATPAPPPPRSGSGNRPGKGGNKGRPHRGPQVHRSLASRGVPIRPGAQVPQAHVSGPLVRPGMGGVCSDLSAQNIMAGRGRPGHVRRKEKLVWDFGGNLCFYLLQEGCQSGQKYISLESLAFFFDPLAPGAGTVQFFIRSTPPPPPCCR